MKKRLALALVPAGLAVIPAAAHACAVCFIGKAPDSAGLLRGLIWGGVILLSFTFAGMGGIVAMVVRIEKERARRELLFQQQKAAASI